MREILQSESGASLAADGLCPEPAPAPGPGVPESLAARLALALDSGAILGTWVWDIPADRFTADERFARTYALDPALCEAGVPISVVSGSIYAGDKARVLEALAVAMACDERYAAEYRVQRSDGERRWIEARGRFERDADGRAVRFSGVLIDIEDRKRNEDLIRSAQLEARRSAHMLEALIEAVPALIYVKDLEGRVLIANAPVTELVGKPKSEIVGRTDAEFLEDKVQSARIMAADRRIMETGASEEREELAGADAEGQRVWLSRKQAFRNEHGVVIGLVGTSIEITTRKRSEEASHRNEAMYRAAMTLGRMGSWEVNLATGIRSWTPEGMHIFGLALEDGRGSVGGAHDELRAAMHPEDRHLLDGYHALANEQSSFAAEYRIVRHGRVRWLSGFGRVLERTSNGAARRIFNVVTDVTEQKEAEERLRFLLRELSHRSNNLLTVVQAITIQTLRQWTNPKDFQERFVDRLCGLAASTSLIAHGEARGASLRLLIERQLEPFIDPKNAQIALGGPEIDLTADAAQAIGLAFHELATNALKHGALSVPQGAVAIDWEMQGDRLRLCWRERGGPPVKLPDRVGFGTTVMTQMVSQSVDGTVDLDLAPDGLRWTLEAPVASIAQ